MQAIEVNIHGSKVHMETFSDDSAKLVGATCFPSYSLSLVIVGRDGQKLEQGLRANHQY
jgi:hypothetical protein